MHAISSLLYSYTTDTKRVERPSPSWKHWGTLGEAITGGHRAPTVSRNQQATGFLHPHHAQLEKKEIPSILELQKLLARSHSYIALTSPPPPLQRGWGS